MTVFKNAKWIWREDTFDTDDYVSFQIPFETNKNHLTLKLSCDSIYAVYLNGKFVKSMQCSDYPHYKFYDEISLEINNTKNIIQIDVWHLGVATSNYFPYKAGLIFELIDDDENVVSYSSKDTSSRVMNEFSNGLNKRITTQLGLSFEYDLNKIDNVFTKSYETDVSYQTYTKRDIHNLDVLALPKIKIIKQKKSILIDLGKETVGYPTLKFISKTKQNILITFGEHIIDGGVRRLIGDRDFSFNVICKEGENNIFNPLRRIACRYMEVFANDDITIDYIGLTPICYHHDVIKQHFDDELIRQIYDTSIYTLECCMHDHYEDCPWREQALYTLDSRNQMLCGYYVFKGFEYQRHNLLLISKDPMTLGLLALCYPTQSEGLAIPMFSLAFIIQTYEYVKYTKDFSILDEVKEPIEKIINFFLARIDNNGLIKYLEKPFWNFYEWTPGSENDDVFDPKSPQQKDQYDLIINAMFVYALNLYNQLFTKNINIENIKKCIQKSFYDETEHLYKMHTKTDKFSQFGNALAILIGLGDEITFKKVKECKNMVEASLPVRGFVYDAILKNNKNDLEFIIEDIKARYKKMLDDGATTFYEVEEGASAFANAGSLCHGWSALPIYYFFLMKGRL